MGFFKDLKEDFSQAMSELIPDEDFLPEHTNGESANKNSKNESERSKGKSKKKNELQDMLEEELRAAVSLNDEGQDVEEQISDELSNDDLIRQTTNLFEGLFDDEPDSFDDLSFADQRKERSAQIKDLGETELEMVDRDLQKQQDLEQEVKAMIDALSGGETNEAEWLEETEDFSQSDGMSDDMSVDMQEEVVDISDFLGENSEHSIEPKELFPSDYELFDERKETIEIDEPIEIMEQNEISEEITEEEQIQEFAEPQQTIEQTELIEYIKLGEELEQWALDQDLEVWEFDEDIFGEEPEKERIQLSSDDMVLPIQEMSDLPDEEITKDTPETDQRSEETTEEIQINREEDQMSNLEEVSMKESDATDMELIAQLMGEDNEPEVLVDEEILSLNESNIMEDMEDIKPLISLEEVQLEQEKAVTIVTKGTTIGGNITSDGSLEIMGTVNGDIDCLGKLTVVGSVNGNSSASEIIVNSARLKGGLQSSGSVNVGVGTIVVGDIKANSAVVAGAVKGELDVDGPVIIDSTAIVKGNINAKSVQINNGAVVDGYCSLTYASVDLEHFFDDKTDGSKKTETKKNELKKEGKKNGEK